MKDNASVRTHGVATRAEALSLGHKGRLGHVWDEAVHGFSVTLSEADAEKMAADPDVDYVEQDQRWTVAGTQTSPPAWSLDRVDQRTLPLDTSYTYDDSAGAGVHAYVIDTGIRTSHSDFGGRASYGWDFVDNDDTADDCNGHGTDVAGNIGGAKYGVAKKVQLVSVRVFDCHGLGDGDAIVNGINWVVAHAVKPAVINLSVGVSCKDQVSQEPGPCPTNAAQMLINAVNGATAAGISVVSAAGNDDQDACNVPTAAASGSITVGATDRNDARWVSTDGSSNFGPCLDIWAPGADIPSDGWHSDTDTATGSGSSFAAPQATGAVALLLGTPRFANATPAQIKTQLTDKMATTGLVTGGGATSPNKLLFTRTPSAYGGTSVALTRTVDGRLRLFGVTKDGFVRESIETAAGSHAWSAGTQSVTRDWLSVSAAPSADGNRMELIGLNSSDQVWRRREVAADTDRWLNLFQLSGLLESVDAVRNTDGRMEMFGANKQGQVFYNREVSAGSDTWGQWTQIPFAAAQMRSVTAERKADGRIKLVGVDTTGQVWETQQTGAGTDDWLPFSPLDGGKSLTEVAMSHNNDGTLELLGTDGLGSVWHRTQLFADSDDWSDWLPLSSKVMFHLAAECSAACSSTGVVDVIGVDSSGNVWESHKTSPGATTYTGWVPVSGQLRP